MNVEYHFVGTKNELENLKGKGAVKGVFRILNFHLGLESNLLEFVHFFLLDLHLYVNVFEVAET